MSHPVQGLSHTGKSASSLADFPVFGAGLKEREGIKIYISVSMVSSTVNDFLSTWKSWFDFVVLTV